MIATGNKPCFSPVSWRSFVRLHRVNSLARNDPTVRGKLVPLLDSERLLGLSQVIELLQSRWLPFLLNVALDFRQTYCMGDFQLALSVCNLLPDALDVRGILNLRLLHHLLDVGNGAKATDRGVLCRM